MTTKFKIVSKRLEPFACDECAEEATYKNTYLLPDARRNPRSKAYGKDDCSWSSDYDQFLCSDCHANHPGSGVPEGYEWCATFERGKFPRMFEAWNEYPAQDLYGALEGVTTELSAIMDMAPGNRHNAEVFDKIDVALTALSKARGEAS